MTSDEETDVAVGKVEGLAFKHHFGLSAPRS